MTTTRVWIAGAIAMLPACAPVTTTKRVVESPQAAAVQRDPTSTHAPELSVVVSAAGDGVEVTSVDRLTCVEHDVTLVHRREIRHRHVNTPITVMEYVLGIGLGGVGAYAVAAPDDAVTHTGAADIKPDDMRKAGIGMASLGGVFLISGVINSVRGGTSNHALADERRVAAAGRSVDCGVAPRAGEDLALVAGGKSWPIGTTDHDGRVRLAWTAVPAEVFATEEWRTAQVTGGAGSTAKPVAVAIDGARVVAATRAWEALVAAPSPEGAHAYLARFAGTRDAEAAQLITTLADTTYAPLAADAMAHADVEATRKVLVAWNAEAPTSAQRVAAATAFAELERDGAPTYLYTRFEASVADPAKLGDAERTLALFATVAPADPRLGPARALLAQRRAEGDRARVKNLQAHVAQARHFARHAEPDRAAAELAAAKQLATTGDDALIAATVAYVDQYRLAAEQQQAAQAARAQAAADAKAKRDEQLAVEKARREEAAAAEKARREEAVAAEKARRETLAAKSAEERTRIAEQAAADKRAREEAAAAEKARRDELAMAAVAKREQAAAEAKAKAADAATAAKARRDEQLATAKAHRDEQLAAAQLAAAEAAGREQASRTRAVPTTDRALPRTGMAGMWAAAVSGSIWLLDLGTDGTGRTALWQGGQIVALRPVVWRLEADALVLQVGGSTMRAHADRVGDALRWSGLAWRRQ